MKTNYFEKTGLLGKFFLTTLIRCASCNIKLACISILKLAGIFYRLLPPVSLLHGSDSLTINFFLSIGRFANQLSFSNNIIISNQINSQATKTATVLAIPSCFYKWESETRFSNTLKTILSKESCNNLYKKEKCFSNTMKKVLKLMPARLA